MEAVWLEISLAKSAPILVGFCYRNPASRIDWMDAFTEIMDRVTFETKEIILLGDFNMDLKKKQIPGGNIALTHIIYKKNS